MIVAPLLVTGLISLGGACLFCLGRMRVLQRNHRAQKVFTQRLLQAQEQERKRIAGELHGSVGQNLLIIKNRADLGLAPGTDAAGTKTQLEQISVLCSEALEQTRRIAHNLGPRHLEQLGLTAALDAMIDRVAASTHIRFERKLEGVDDLFDNEGAASVYRIAEEALNNVMKHAGAGSARVHLQRDLHHVRLIIEDDGRGYDSAKANGGLGLAVIRERVRILNGDLELDSVAGRGTRLSATIPFRANGAPVHN